MLAARVIRKKKFALVNFNDAAVVFLHDSNAIDWDELCRQALRFGLKPELAVLLAKGEQLVDGSVIPTFVSNRLQLGPWRSSLAWLSHGVAGPFSELGSTRTPTDRRRPTIRMWVTAIRLWQNRSQEGERLRDVLWSNLGRRIFRWQLKRVRSGRMPIWMGQIGRLLRPRCGAFCEVSPHLDDRASLQIGQLCKGLFTGGPMLQLTFSPRTGFGSGAVATVSPRSPSLWKSTSSRRMGCEMATRHASSSSQADSSGFPR